MGHEHSASFRNYEAQVGILPPDKRKRLRDALQDPEALRTLMHWCRRNQAISIEIDDDRFTVESVEDLQNLREELDLSEEIPV